MSPRARALGFAAGAIACAVLAAAAAGSYTREATEGLGRLVSVVVTVGAVPEGAEITPRSARTVLDARQVPAAFAPPAALASPEQALGRRLAVALPPGSYVTASVLAEPATGEGRRRGRAPSGTTPVELEVVGAGGLAGAARRGSPVDVVVAGGTGPGPGAARAFVAARRVPLLGLASARPEPGLGERWIATLALTRPQALALIRADSVGRTLRLLAR